MTTKSESRGIGRLLQTLRAHDAEGRSDGQLLERFLAHQDEAAFAALVRRHGPMVFGVCRRVLGNDADSEDAFQATFLVLVRKAPALRARAILGDWLHGVARYTALKAKAAAVRRRAKEQVMARPDATAEEVRNDWLPLLDEELARLPEKYRLPVVLCDLEGKTRREAADQLGWPEGTVAGRLTRARTMLAKGLARHGIVFSGGVLAVALSHNAASACVPALAVFSTIKAAMLLAAGQAVGVISPHVAALTEGVLKTMFLNKLKTVMTVLFGVLGLIVGSGGLYMHQAEAQQGIADKAPAAGETDAKPEKEGFTAWGKEIGGLQAGLGYLSGQKRPYSHGETVTLVVRVRNVSKDTVKFSYLQPFIEHSFTVTGRDGKPVPQPKIVPDIGERDAGVVELAPGKEIVLHELKRQFRPASECGSDKGKQPYALYGTGKINVRYNQVFGPPDMGVPGWKLDPALSKLATGRLELEVKDMGEALKDIGEVLAEDKVAWGDEVDGLQAGLSLAERKTEQAGDTGRVDVKLEVKIRNVSKAPVKITASQETTPTIAENGGERIWVTMPDVIGPIEVPIPRVIEAGETITLLRPKLIVEVNYKQPLPKHVDLPTVRVLQGKYTISNRLASASLLDLFSVRVHQGKYTISYSGMVDSHQNLTTGKITLMGPNKTGKAENAQKKEDSPPKQEKEAFTSWGKEVGGVQAGLGYLAGQKRPYSHGETVNLVVRVRNLGKKEVKFAYFNEFFYANTPVVTDGKGKMVPLVGLDFTGEPRLVEVNLAPGKEIELCQLNLELRSAGERGEDRPAWTLYGTGKFQLQHENIGGGTIGGGNKIKFDPILSNLATGKLALEVKDAEELPQKREKEKEGFTSWGKEFGGLQAGLGFSPGEKRPYNHGETVKLVVRVRNVGKEAVKFSYLQPFIEHAPTVTDGDNKAVPQPSVMYEIGARLAGVVDLAPGKEIDLHELKRDLRPASESGSNEFMQRYALYGTGKVKVQYHQVLGSPSMRVPGWKLDPALSKLASGVLELEVKDAKELPQNQDKEKEGVTSWGKEVGGLQAGLCFSNASDIRIGGKAKAVVKLRNVSKEAIFVSAWPLWLSPRQVVDMLGKPVRTTTPPPHAGINIDPDLLTLKPGQTVEVDKIDFIVAALDQRVKVPEGIVDFFAIHVQPGKYKADCIEFLKEHPTLSTGTVEFEVKPALEIKSDTSDATENKEPQKQERTAANGEIVGRLIDVATGKPVEGATIACGAIINDSGEGGGANSVTDAQGRYRLLVPSPGIYNVWLKEFTKDSSKTAAADDGIVVEAGKVAMSQLHLVAGRKVVGKVVDSEGKPLANLPVSCHSPARPQSGGVHLVNSKPDGTFEFLLPPGRAWVYVIEQVGKTDDNPFGVGRAARAVLDVSGMKVVPPMTLTLQKSESIFGDPEWIKRSTPGTQIVRRESNQDVTGIVVDGKGKPIAGAKVFRYDGPLVPTNDKGDFRIKTMKGTQLVIYAFAPGYHVWCGTPTSGDVLKIVLEPKLPHEGRGKTPLKQKPEEDKRLTVDLAKKLIPPAAGISNADLEALLKDRQPDVVKSKSLSLAILAFRPPKNPIPGADKEFRFLGDNINVSDITQAIWISKDKGYASFIQANDITECSCESTAKRAEGVVTFKNDLFAGRIPFVAQASTDGWVITEFRLPQYKIRVVRGKDGVWSQEVLKGK